MGGGEEIYHATPPAKEVVCYITYFLIDIWVLCYNNLTILSRGVLALVSLFVTVSVL